MSRARRRSQQTISLFPFLDILSGVIGTFFLIIAGMTVLSIEAAVQVIELPRAAAQQKRPYYVECRAEGVFLPQHPEDYLPNHRLELLENADMPQSDSPDEGTPGILVPLDEMDRSGNPWLEQLQIIGENRFDEYLILLVRDDGLESFRKARRAAEQLGIDVGFSPVPAGGDIRLEMPPQKPKETDEELDFEFRAE